jgi:peptide/nickel transport system ATP-binding protein
MAMLEVRNLKTYFEILQGYVKAVDDVSFTLDRGETMGLVGESGCGKTTMAFAITRLLPSNGDIVGGEIRFNDVVIGRADLATEVNELLKRDDWLPEIQKALARRGAFQDEGDVVKLAEGDILASEASLEVDLRVLERLKDAMAMGAEDGESLRLRLQRVVDRERRSWSARRRLRKREREIEERMASIRWSEISMIFQSAMNAFNPVYKVGDQIMEALLTHQDMSNEEARNRVKELFELVGLDESRIDGYPHEFSGGMRQRAIIAMALACNPQLIIADEPTTALDVIMQDRILTEIRDLQKRLGIAMMIITHDISVVAEVAEKIAIMYAGKLVEYGAIEKVFARPSNPYTIGLMGAFPSIKGDRKQLQAIPGSPPDLADPPTGCRFHPRCKYAKDICKVEEPELLEVEEHHLAACHFAREVYTGELEET